MTKYVILIVFVIAIAVITPVVYDRFHIHYRFWHFVLTKGKWLYNIWVVTSVAVMIALSIVYYITKSFSVFSLTVIYVILVRSLLPRRNSSYKDLYDAFVKNSDYWENLIKKEKKR